MSLPYANKLKMPELNGIQSQRAGSNPKKFSLQREIIFKSDVNN